MLIFSIRIKPSTSCLYTKLGSTSDCVKCSFNNSAFLNFHSIQSQEYVVFNTGTLSSHDLDLTLDYLKVATIDSWKILFVQCWHFISCHGHPTITTQLNVKVFVKLEFVTNFGIKIECYSNDVSQILLVLYTYIIHFPGRI